MTAATIRYASAASSLAFVLLVVFGAGPVVGDDPGLRPLTQGPHLAGDGTASDPYVVTNASGLQAMADDLGAQYVLGADVDASATAGWHGGAGFVPIGDGSTPFVGRLDGRGHVVTNLTVNRSDADAVGLFGVLGEGAEVSNLVLEGVNVRGSSAVGALAGRLAGRSSNVSVGGSVAGHGAVGGIVGVLSAGAIERSTAEVDVTGSGQRVGGVVGTASGSAGDVVTIANVSSHGSVTGVDRVGGLVGRGEALDLEASFAAAAVAATGGEADPGAVAGVIDGDATAVYWDVDAAGTDGAVGSGPIDGVKGLSTGRMTDAAPAVYMPLAYGPAWRLQAGTYPTSAWTAGADGFVADEPIVIDAPGDYRLHADVAWSAAGNGLLLRADDVVLDGGGHAATGGNLGVYVRDRTDVTVRNLALDGWVTGIHVGASAGIRLERVAVRDSLRNGIELVDAVNGSIVDTSVTGAGGRGIDLRDGSHGNVLSGVTVADTAGTGIRLESGGNRLNETRLEDVADAGSGLSVSGDGNALVDTAVRGAGGAGIAVVGSDTLLDGVTVGWAGGAGIEVDRSASNATISAARVRAVAGWALDASGSNVRVTALDVGASVAPNTTVDARGGGFALGAASAPAASPDGMAAIDRYVDATNTTPSPTLELTVHYGAADVDRSVAEGTLGLWRRGADGWQPVAGSTVDTSRRVVRGEPGSLSPLGILGERRFEAVDRCAVLDAPGRYELVADLRPTNLEGAACLEIAADGVSVDGRGHAVAGDPVAAGDGVSVEGATNVTVANLSVTGWTGAGVRVRNASAVTVADIRAATNDDGVHAGANSSGVSIADVRVADNDEAGLRLRSTDAEVSTVIARDNGWAVIANGTGSIPIADLDVGPSTRPGTTVSLTAGRGRIGSVTRPPANPHAVAIGRYVAVDPIDGGAVELVLRYDDADLGDVVEETLEPGLHDGAGWHAPASATVDTGANLARATVDAGGTLGLFGATTAPAPRFVRSDLEVSPDVVGVEVPISVSHLVENRGDAGGYFETVVLVDGYPYATVSGAYLAPGSRRTVSTTVTLSEPGTYTVGVADLAGPPYWATVRVEGTPVCRYADATGVVGTSGLLAAIVDWRVGTLEASGLLEVIDAWRDGRPVEGCATSQSPASVGEFARRPVEGDDGARAGDGGDGRPRPPYGVVGRGGEHLLDGHAHRPHHEAHEDDQRGLAGPIERGVDDARRRQHPDGGPRQEDHDRRQRLHQVGLGG